MVQLASQFTAPVGGGGWRSFDKHGRSRAATKMATASLKPSPSSLTKPARDHLVNWGARQPLDSPHRIWTNRPL